MSVFDITTEKHNNSAKELLLAQIRECFGRVVYTHKTHEKQSEIFVRNEKFWKGVQIVLSVIVPGTLIVTLGRLFGYEKIWTLMGLLLSVALAVVTLYFKNFNYGVEIQRHKTIAIQLLAIRESYVSLINDVMANCIDFDLARKNRDDLMRKLENIYVNAPITSQTAYKKAQKALKLDEELTFSSNEIDKLLPEELRLNKNKEVQ